MPGPLVWDLSSGTATDTTESLHNSGWAPDSQVTHGRAFAEDLPKRDLNPSEAQVLSMTITREPGQTICNSWDVTDHRGEPITIGFVARVLAEEEDDGSQRLILRAMNWRGEHDGESDSRDYLAQRILKGLAQPGAHRALVDLTNWTLLKWLDDPAPFFNWRASLAGDHLVHPDDRAQIARMTEEFATGCHFGHAAVGGQRRWVDARARDGQPRRARGRRVRRVGDATSAVSRPGRRERRRAPYLSPAGPTPH